MDQDRYIEYDGLVRDTFDYPQELNGVNKRLSQRLRRRFTQRVIANTSAFVGCMVLFAALVNTSAVFAQTVNSIPIIGDLADIMKFDRGLHNAINNRYAQEVNLKQSANGYTLELPYVIADSKRLVLLFQMPEKLLNQGGKDAYQVLADDSIFRTLDAASVNYWNLAEHENAALRGLQAISIRTDESEIPKEITIPISLVRLNGKTKDANKDNSSAVPNENIEGKPAVLASYQFKLRLNDFAQPVTTRLDRRVQVLGQTVMLESVTEYATGVEIRATAPNDGTAIISGLEFRGIDEKGGIWKMPETSAQAVTFHDASADIIYYLENNYFGDASLSELELTGVGMFMKAEEKVTVNLTEKTMLPALPDLYIKNIEKRGSNAHITFESSVRGLSMDDIVVFDTRYEDQKSNAHVMTDYQRSSQDGGKTQYSITVAWPQDNKVILKRYRDPVKSLQNPVKISLNKGTDTNPS